MVLRGPTDSRIDAGSGVALRILTWEGIDGAPFLLVHGLASNGRTWEQVAGGLAKLGHPVVAVDLRGHGRSDKPEVGYDFETLAGDLLACLDRLEWERCLVVGQSLGGNLVVDLAGRAPKRLAGIVGVDGGAIELARRWPDWDDCAEKLAPPPLAGTAASAVKEMLRRAHPSWTEWGIAATMANFEELDDATVSPWLSREHHMTLLRSLWEHRPSLALAGLDVPVTLLMATDSRPGRDEARRAEIDEIVAGAPDVEVHWFPGADHDIHVQKPHEVAEHLHRAAGGCRT